MATVPGPLKNAPPRDGIAWFKQQFASVLQRALANTPFSVDMAAAIAMQETFTDCWGRLFKSKTTAEVLQLCVGDTIDNRTARPRGKADLCSAPDGQQMFDVARQALLAIAQYNADYARAAQNPNKFCHGFGIFQYDIQYFFGPNKDFFLNQGWYDFEQCLAHLIGELNESLKIAYGSHKTSLTDDEMMYVAIAYNAGRVIVGGGPKQGHEDSDGLFYGEGFQKYLALAHKVTAPAKVLELAATRAALPKKRAGESQPTPSKGSSKRPAPKKAAGKTKRSVKPSRKPARKSAGKNRGRR